MRVLLLAGTAEARALAARLARHRRIAVLASLAGETRAPLPLGVPTRVGGFGGAAGQAAFIQHGRFDAVVDATHPFARTMPRRSEALCARLGLPYLRLLRPGWRAGPGDRWHLVGAERDVAEAAPPGARLFLATGRKSLALMGNLAGRAVVCRVVDPPSAPFPWSEGAWRSARPPFTLEAEIAALRETKADFLVAKDAGGAAGRRKLEAARALDLPVILIRRPAPPGGARAASVPAALSWLERRA